MRPSDWTYEYAAGLVAECGNLAAIGRAEKCDRGVVKKYLDKLGVPYEHSRVPGDRRPPAPVFEDLKEYPHDPEALFAFVEQACAERAKRKTAQKTATVRLDVDMPIGVAQFADLHVGSENTRHNLIRRDCAMVRDTPGLYAGFLGDYWDGFLKDSMKDGQHEAVISVQMQRLYVWNLFRYYLPGKVLYDLTGQHEAWANQLADFDPVEWLSHDRRVPYLKHGGTVNLTVGKITYRLALRHKARGRSETNPTHSNVKQLVREGHYDAVVHADRHEAATQDILFQGKWSALVRPGSYKPSDNHSEAGGFPEAEPIMPVILFWPNERRVQSVKDIATAAEVLQTWWGDANGQRVRKGRAGKGAG